MKNIFPDRKFSIKNKAKEKCADELILANKKLLFQNLQKEKQAEELLKAIEKLEFQNKEKVKSAEELFLANKELVFQNHEKEKRTMELMVANTELNKTQEYLKKNLFALEEMMFMVSHNLKQPIATILDLSNLLILSENSPSKLKISIKYIKQSALSLNDFSKELNSLICFLKQQGNNRIEFEKKAG
ncbi:MAG: hypothetical protein H0V01_10460 [Bacteroidetes bacterium]|nr:hypothetical protein [Bacteroidota bacterium]HET6245080.1 hypothetical protein [Bacteroidia bacterium]